MRYIAISETPDTLTGLRLAGIEGMLVNSSEDIRLALEAIDRMEDVAIVLVTRSLINNEWVAEHRHTKSRPLILEIPAPQDAGQSASGITNTIQNAVGIKM